jgi:hypothetical protein
MQPMATSADDGTVAPKMTITPAQSSTLEATLKRLNAISLGLGIPALILQSAGNTMGGGIGGLLALAGTLMLICGLAFYAQYRGRHWAFGFLGLLSCIGLFVLYFLPKRCLHCDTKHKYSAIRCSNCDAPLGR